MTKGAPNESSGQSPTGSPRRSARQRSKAQPRELASDDDALWDESALSAAGAVPEEAFSPGVRVALERIFAAETPARLGRVAEQSVGYGGAEGATAGGQASEDDGAGVAALAARHGVTLETLAARMDLSPAILRALAAGEANGGVTLTNLPPALLAQFAGALDAPLAEVAQALQAPSEDNGQAPTDATDDRRLAGSAFVDLITMAPSLSEAQRRHWLALLAANPT